LSFNSEASCGIGGAGPTLVSACRNPARRNEPSHQCLRSLLHVADPDASSRPAGPSFTPEQARLGTAMLQLVSDWDAWVYRRVDSFRFAGDDERVLERHQSMDFQIPQVLVNASSTPATVPVPITIVNKWRLPEFSLRDEGGLALPLLARTESTPLAAAMLCSLAHAVMGSEPPLASADHQLSLELDALLLRIAASDSVEAVDACAELVRCPDRRGEQLAVDEGFMGLAYEFARGFPLIALVPCSKRHGRRVLKFTYASYVVSARPDPVRIQLAHTLRSIRNRAWDRTETSGWQHANREAAAKMGALSFSVKGRYVAERLREQEREGGIACVLASVTGPDGRHRTIRLRPNAAMRLHSLPGGNYTVAVRGVSGFRIRDASGIYRDKVEYPYWITNTEVPVVIVARRDDVEQKVTKSAPRVAARAWLFLRLSRALALNNKPLAIRLRLGDGGSYHCEFEAPPGMHVTRARLVSDVRIGPEVGVEPEWRGRERDVVLESKQRAHLYMPERVSRPATGYAYLHLRPRLQTIGLSAFTSALVATLVLAFVAFTWNAGEGYAEHGPPDSSALLVIILGAPSALAAYLVQRAASRVTSSLLTGLRLAGLVPSLLALGAGAVILVGEKDGWSHAHLVLYLLGTAGVMASVVLAIGAVFAEHPREQARTNQGPGFKDTYSVLDDDPPQPVIAAPEPLPRDPGGVRAVMLERSAGMDQRTRRALLSQHTLRRRDWTYQVPPALFFDAAETAPTFRGLGADSETRMRLAGGQEVAATAPKFGHVAADDRR
jgi:hypothetical protein